MHFEHTQFVAGILIQTDFTDAEGPDLTTLERLLDELQTF